MRIEILVGSEEPIIFPLKSSKIIIGSGDNCDVKLDASGISRKHVAIMVEGDQYFVADQGSTNGTFINEERLVPGKRAEFTSFFPVRLGDNVLVSLLSDEEGFEDIQIPFKEEKSSPNLNVKKNDSTTVINLKDLHSQTKSHNLVLERNKKREVRKKTAAAPAKTAPVKKKTNIPAVLAILVVGIAAYINFFVMEKPKEEKIEEVGQIIPAAPKKVVAAEENKDLIPVAELPEKKSFQNLLMDIKCATDLEKYLCDLIPGAKSGIFGVAQVGLTLNVLLDGSAYFDEAKKYVKTPKGNNAEELNAYQATVNKAAMYVFLMRQLPTLDEAKLDGVKVIIAMFKPVENGFEFHNGSAFYPKVINREKPNLQEEQLRAVMNIGGAALSFTDKFYQSF